jgi:hypothetical protein
MQTFLPYPNFAQSAACLDNKRLGKQRVEVLKILNALAKGPQHCPVCLTGPIDQRVCYHPELAAKKLHGHAIKTTAWYNHPATQMWLGYTDRLVAYGMIICDEWIKRGFKDTCRDKIQAMLLKAPTSHIGQTPTWLGREDFHSAHKAALLAKDYSHYKTFGWTETPALNYIWPGQNKN